MNDDVVVAWLLDVEGNLNSLLLTKRNRCARSSDLLCTARTSFGRWLEQIVV